MPGTGEGHLQDMMLALHTAEVLTGTNCGEWVVHSCPAGSTARMMGLGML